MPAGGATFTPRLNPRPKPFDTWPVVRKGLVSHLRVALLTAILCRTVAPLYHGAVALWQSHGWSERSFLVAATTIVHASLYVGMNGFFLLCDVKGWLQQYKLDRTPAMGPSWSLLARTFAEAAVGQLITGPVTIWYVAYPLFKRFGSPAMDAPLPGFATLAAFFLLADVCNGWLFYWSHRAVHSKLLYRRVHKQHHEYKGTVGFAAEFAHPVEQVLSNQGPTIFACLVFGAHFAVWLVWLAVRLEQTYETHSGYCFYGTWLWRIGLTNAEGCAYHDYHHTGNRGNFGGPAYLDHLFGTMDAWVEMGGVEGYVARAREKLARGEPTGNVLREDFVGKRPGERKKAA
jgi:methylsterol monooxygenase